MTLVAPAELNTATWPFAPTLAITRFCTTLPGAKFKLEVNGNVLPAGQTVRYPGALGVTATTFSTTAPTPELGMPARPVTGKSSSAAGPSAPAPAYCPSMVDMPGRVSNRRAGTKGVNSDAAGNQPATSAISSVLPLELKKATLPLAPTF